MKAQMSVEYYISLTIFILFVGYIFFQLIVLSPQYKLELQTERLRSESYQISELLINDPGEPTDWYMDIDTAKRVGLSSNLDKTNLLSEDKIYAFQSACSDYENLRKLLGTENEILIELINITSGEKIISCESPISVTKQTKISITRIVALDSDNMGELTLQMW